MEDVADPEQAADRTEKAQQREDHGGGIACMRGRSSRESSRQAKKRPNAAGMSAVRPTARLRPSRPSRE